MLKRAVFGAAIALVAGTLIFGRDLVSYVRTSSGYVKSAVTDNVPMEFQIQRAKGMIDDLVPEIRKNMHIIAKEEVEVEQLTKQIADSETRLGKEKDGLLRLNADVSTGKGVFQYAGRTYSEKQVKADLACRFERYKTGEATLASLKDIQQARQKGLEAARQKLEGMLAAKRQLYVQVENLEARLKMIEAAQTTSEYSFDESKLGRVKELIGDLRSRLDVAERMVNTEGSLHDEIPLDEPTPSDISNQVTDYFRNPKPAAEAVAKDKPAEKPSL
jgi:chromosome segregation ATPase